MSAVPRRPTRPLPRILVCIRQLRNPVDDRAHRLPAGVALGRSAHLNTWGWRHPRPRDQIGAEDGR